MARVTKMQETRLWKSYQSTSPEAGNIAALEEVYAAAVSWLKEVPKDFSNYTLHDETHVVNVMEAMAGLLGDWISRLSPAEHELLLLAAMLHDIGMVYSPEAKQRTIENADALREFLRKTAPGECGARFDELDEQQQQNYLRSRHAFRVDEVLGSTAAWKKVSETTEEKLLPLDMVAAVCRAHGETEDVLDDEAFAYDESLDCDPRFCALLLRLGDILDFDGSRAPEILFPFTDGIKRSIEAFQKHLASQGFNYPKTPSDAALPYGTRCDDPNIENKLREYLDWVDDELALAERVKKDCTDRWRAFPFPRAISRKNIKGKNYDSVDFRVTMDQEHILKLLTGENLYSDETVFVRELLQNAIDATLLRVKLDARFKADFEKNPDAGAIRLWEWTDDEGQLWFRIDDHGTGMTRRMLLEYFLKVGNSYYESNELKRDLDKSGAREEYTGISRFGIGFLSCFLCGTRAEISTRYYSDTKSAEDNEPKKGHVPGWGLRLSIPGLTGRYVLRNQAKGHPAKKPLPCRETTDALHCEGYRTQPGTSIVLVIDQGKLGARSLREAAQRCLCAPRVPVYYNGEKLVPTYAEVIKKTHELETTAPRYYELNEQGKEKYDERFPMFAGQYPKLEQTVSVFGEGQGRQDVLPGISVVAATYRTVFESMPLWKHRDQEYTLLPECSVSNVVSFNAVICNTSDLTENSDKRSFPYWPSVKENLRDKGDVDTLENLISMFYRSNCCPSEEELGSLWLPFAELFSLSEIWQAWVNNEVGAYTHFEDHKVTYCCDLVFPKLLNNPFLPVCSFAYRGVIAGALHAHGEAGEWQFFLEDKLRPEVDLGRLELRALTPEAALYGELIRRQTRSDTPYMFNDVSPLVFREQPLSRWRELHGTPLGRYAENHFGAEPGMRIVMLKKTRVDSAEQNYLRTLLQDQCCLTVHYEKKVRIESQGARTMPDPRFAPLPPLLFCKAATDKDREYLCALDWRGMLICFTEDHPFSVWLLEHAALLRSNWPRQLDQMLDSLTKTEEYDVFNGLTKHKITTIIQTVEDIRAQWARLPASKQRELGLERLPKLTEADFWKDPEE